MAGRLTIAGTTANCGCGYRRRLRILATNPSGMSGTSPGLPGSVWLQVGQALRPRRKCRRDHPGTDDPGGSHKPIACCHTSRRISWRLTPYLAHMDLPARPRHSGGACSLGKPRSGNWSSACGASLVRSSAAYPPKRGHLVRLRLSRIMASRGIQAISGAAIDSWGHSNVARAASGRSSSGSLRSLDQG